MDRSKLRPRSGVGVIGPHLVIAPAGERVITVDLRLLDCIYADEEAADDEAPDDDGPDGDGAPGDDVDDHRKGPRSVVVLVIAERHVALHIADGAEAVEHIVAAAAPWTRDGAATSAGPKPGAAEIARFIRVGEDAVSVSGDKIRVGRLAFRLADVREYAHRGANVPLPGGGRVQAALLVLVEAAHDREG